MRTKNSIINSMVVLLSYSLLFLGPFIVRPFLAEFGKEILGIEDLFLKTVSMLSIVEMGISFGIIYKLYKPIADNDTIKIAILLNFYKSAFKLIATLVFLLGLITSLIIPLFIKEKLFSFQWLSFIFILYVIDALSAYLFGHKRAMIIADQKNYIVSLARLTCQMAMFVSQSFVIYLFKSFELYVIIRIAFTVLENVIIHIQYRRMYSHIDLKITTRLPKDEKSDLFKNLSALMLHKVGYQSLTSASALIMSGNIGVGLNGIYSNYAFITYGLLRVTDQIFSSVLSSFGNLIVKSTRDHVYNVYKKIYFLNHLIISFISVSLLCLINPFIGLWMGSRYMLGMDTVLMILIYFYMMGMRQSISMVKVSAGIYRPDRYFALFEALVNISFSIVLVTPFGINGILAANIISMLIVPFWTQPVIVYRNVFKTSVADYYHKYFLYLFITACSACASFYICSSFKSTGVLGLFYKAIVCVCVPNLVNLIVFYNSQELKYLYRVFDDMAVSHIKRKKTK